MTLGLVTGAPVCPCGTQLSAEILACPSCQRLVHAEALKAYQLQAEQAAADADVSAELSAWRQAIVLLPAGSKQYASVAARISALTDAALAAPTTSDNWRWTSGLGAAGLLIWKFKFLVVAALTKGKFLLLGLTKSSTLLTMLLSFGVYWTAWGMWFALGVVVSIYIHEMGHVAALRRFGIPATAPMFVPGLGALIRMRAAHLSPREDARVGLAGPVWGLAAAVAALGVAMTAGSPMWLAIAHTGAWLNAFNLLPVWQLDGSRGLSAISRPQRWLIVGAFAAGWFICGDGLFVLLALAAIARAAVADAPEASDRRVVALFAGLVLALAAVIRASAINPAP